jgi:hypothetical protein
MGGVGALSTSAPLQGFQSFAQLASSVRTVLSFLDACTDDFGTGS